jgi:hypothetical protein
MHQGVVAVIDAVGGLEVVKLSKTQTEVVRRLKETGKPLQRWPGGFWTTEQPPAAMNKPAPEWWCGTQTVRVLERVGVIVPKDQKRDWWKQHYVLTGDE